MRQAWALIGLVFASVSGVAAWASEDLQQLNTDDLQLIWMHPAEDYLAPHVARSFENSMAFQRNI